MILYSQVQYIELRGGDEMSYDYSKLRGRIVEKFGTLGEFAKAMKWSERTNSLKMNGVREWKQSEIVAASRLLGISPEDIDVYFFDIEVQDIEQNSKRRTN